MADPAKEAAMKQRIITHMNGDHQDSLKLYLRHKHHLDEAAVENAKLIDLNLKQLVITASGQCYTLAMEPPMQSLRDARERMVAMDTEARTALGLPAHSHGAVPALVTRYVPPSGFDLVVWFAVLSTFVVFSRQGNVQPGGWAYEYLAIKLAPKFAAFCQAIQFKLFTGMVALHGAEAGYLGAVKLRSYGVSTGSPLWFKWVLSTFVDGVFGYKRLSAHVKQNQKGGSNRAVNGKAH